MSWLSDAFDYIGGGDKGSNWGGIFSLLNGAVNTFGQVSSANADRKQNQQNLEMSREQAMALNDADNATALEIAKINAGAAGAGVGQQIAYNKQRDKYQGVLGAYNSTLSSRNADSQNVSAAIKTLVGV